MGRLLDHLDELRSRLIKSLIAVGIGTVVFAFGMGPLVQFFLQRLSLIPVASSTGE